MLRSPIIKYIFLNIYSIVLRRILFFFILFISINCINMNMRFFYFMDEDRVNMFKYFFYCDKVVYLEENMIISNTIYML